MGVGREARARVDARNVGEACGMSAILSHVGGAQQAGKAADRRSPYPRNDLQVRKAAMPTDQRGYVLSGETAACDKCGEETDINLLDAKDDGSGDYTILHCEKCYGPSWAPMAIADQPGKSANVSQAREQIPQQVP